MNKKSTQIALGGLFSALCLVLMFLSAVVPFATFALPMLAGAMLVAVVLENGAKTALLVYVAVSVLSVFIVPDPEATLIFVCLFGYYPIVKARLEKLPGRVLEYGCKLALFNITIVGAYLGGTYLLGIPNLLEGMGDFGRYTGLLVLMIGNVTFLLYDFLLTRYITVYVRWFKPTFLKR